MITKQQEDEAREMARTIYKSENAGRTKGKKAMIAVCGYTGQISTSLPVKCCKCNLTVYRDGSMKDYYEKKAKMYCISCFLKTKYKKTALEMEILTKAQRIHDAKKVL